VTPEHEELNDTDDEMNKINGSKAYAMKQKFYSCLSNNKEFKVMCNISCVLEGEVMVDSEDLKVLSVSDMCYREGQTLTF
jgi:hypothetical protein